MSARSAASGPSIQYWLKKLGVEATSEQIDELLAMVKEKSLEKKGLLTDMEFRKLVGKVVG